MSRTVSETASFMVYSAVSVSRPAKDLRHNIARLLCVKEALRATSNIFFKPLRPPPIHHIRFQYSPLRFRIPACHDRKEE